MNSAGDLAVPILLISGDPGKIERLKDGAIPFLKKPFLPRTLIAMVDRLLGQAED